MQWSILLKGSVLYFSLVAVRRFFPCCPVVGKYTDDCEFASLIVKKPFFRNHVCQPVEIYTNNALHLPAAIFPTNLHLMNVNSL